MKPCKYLVAAFIALIPAMANAHTGMHDTMASTGFIEGFVHPFSGIDHLIALMLVGLMVYRYDAGRSVFFTGVLLALVIGALAGSILGAQAWVEAAILLSIPAFLALQWFGKSMFKLPFSLACLFLLTHGWSHGVEMGSISPGFMAGFILSSAAVIHMAGMLRSGLILKIKNTGHA